MRDPDMLRMEISRAREQACALLDGLLAAKAASEVNLSQAGIADLYKKVTGHSSLDAALTSTRRMIESYDRMLAELDARPAEPVIRVMDPLRSGVVA